MYRKPLWNLENGILPAKSLLLVCLRHPRRPRSAEPQRPCWTPVIGLRSHHSGPFLTYRCWFQFQKVLVLVRGHFKLFEKATPLNIHVQIAPKSHWQVSLHCCFQWLGSWKSAKEEPCKLALLLLIIWDVCHHAKLYYLRHFRAITHFTRINSHPSLVSQYLFNQHTKIQSRRYITTRVCVSFPPMRYISRASVAFCKQLFLSSSMTALAALAYLSL